MRNRCACAFADDGENTAGADRSRAWIATAVCGVRTDGGTGRCGDEEKEFLRPPAAGSGVPSPPLRRRRTAPLSAAHSVRVSSGLSQQGNRARAPVTHSTAVQFKVSHYGEFKARIAPFVTHRAREQCPRAVRPPGKTVLFSYFLLHHRPGPRTTSASRTRLGTYRHPRSRTVAPTPCPRPTVIGRRAPLFFPRFSLNLSLSRARARSLLYRFHGFQTRESRCAPPGPPVVTLLPHAERAAHGPRISALPTTTTTNTDRKHFPSRPRPPRYNLVTTAAAVHRRMKTKENRIGNDSRE